MSYITQIMLLYLSRLCILQLMEDMLRSATSPSDSCDVLHRDNINEVLGKLQRDSHEILGLSRQHDSTNDKVNDRQRVGQSVTLLFIESRHSNLFSLPESSYLAPMSVVGLLCRVGQSRLQRLAASELGLHQDAY